MKPTIVGIIVVLALLVGAGVGYYLLPGLTNSRTSTTTTMTSVKSTSVSHEISLACGYLTSNYNATMGLVAETPSHHRYFLYSDNYLAAIVLSQDCNRPALSRSINQTLALYSLAQIPNQYLAFDCREYFGGSGDYRLSDVTWTTINNQTGPPLNDSYADIAFLQALYTKACSHDLAGAILDFQAGASEYDGVGFNDIPFQSGQSAGTYQTYKLALYIFTAVSLGQSFPQAALADLMSLQARGGTSGGGFYTGYSHSFSTAGASTNTETTCLAIMALASYLPKDPL